MNETIVIAGAGHAAGQCAATLRQKRFAGKIVMFGNEAWLPYQRPPLSKKYLAGDIEAERLFVKPQSFYDDIDVQLNTNVESIQLNEKTVCVAGNESVAFDKLVIATGSRPRPLPVAGMNLDGVHYLRSIDDVDRIRARVSAGMNIVVVGAGYIGLEVAAVAAQLKLNVTVVETEDRVMRRVVSEAVSDFYQRIHDDNGVTIRLSTSLQRMSGASSVQGVILDTGEEIPADLVIVGIGIEPNLELADHAGLEINNGIVVDDRCRTRHPDIYAIGDCTFHPNSVLGRSLRLESVQNALEQAKVAAANICGEDVRYAQVPWFWSDQYDLKLQIAGLSSGYDDTVLRGDPDSGSFACFYLRDNRLIAVDAVNKPREFVQSKLLIAEGRPVDKTQLFDEDVQLKDLD